MEDDASPEHYSNTELTLKAISLTFQRARVAQRELTCQDTVERSDDRPTVTPADPADELDAALDTEAGDGPAAPDPDDTSPLPNPIVTDANLRHYLHQAGGHRGSTGVGGLLGTARTVARRTRYNHQPRYNEAILNALHQLDHRTRLQSRTIATIEAELAEVRRTLAALEAERMTS